MFLISYRVHGKYHPFIEITNCSRANSNSRHLAAGCATILALHGLAAWPSAAWPMDRDNSVLLLARLGNDPSAAWPMDRDDSVSLLTMPQKKTGRQGTYLK